MPAVIYFWVGLSHGLSADVRAPDELRLLALTVATDETNGYKRFMKSAKANHIDVKVFFNYLFASIIGVRFYSARILLRFTVRSGS